MAETYKKIQAAFVDKLQKFNIEIKPNQRSYLALYIDQKGDLAETLKYLPDFKYPLDKWALFSMIHKNIDNIKGLVNELGLDLSNFIFEYSKSEVGEILVIKIGKEKVFKLFQITENMQEESIYTIFSKMDMNKFIEGIKLSNQIYGTNINLATYINELKLAEKIKESLDNNEISISQITRFLPIKSSFTTIENIISNLSDDKVKALTDKISNELQNKLHALIKEGDKEKITEFIEELRRSQYALGEQTNETLRTLMDYLLITSDDIRKPRYLFDRYNEIAQNTLGESIANPEKRTYSGHWIDRTYFNTADFCDLYAIWLHEICHKGGGDGTAQFTYILTDMIKVISSSNTSCKDANKRLKAIEEVYNSLSKTNQAA